MSFRYQKRIKLGKGLGLNLSRSGISANYRTKHGSIGTRGFTVKTGLRGLSYRSNWKRGGCLTVIVFIPFFLLLLAYKLFEAFVTEQ